MKTETTNRRARSFYERHGFVVETLEVEAIDGHDVDVWRLSRPL